MMASHEQNEERQKKERQKRQKHNLYQSQEIPKQNKTCEKLFVGSSINWLFKWIVVSETKIFIAVLIFFSGTSHHST